MVRHPRCRVRQTDTRRANHNGQFVSKCVTIINWNNGPPRRQAVCDISGVRSFLILRATFQDRYHIDLPMNISKTSARCSVARIMSKVQRAVTFCLRPGTSETNPNWLSVLADEFIETEDDMFAVVYTPLVPVDTLPVTDDADARLTFGWRFKMRSVVGKTMQQVSDTRARVSGWIVAATTRIRSCGEARTQTME
jgi:hypothetical protein